VVTGTKDRIVIGPYHLRVEIVLAKDRLCPAVEDPNEMINGIITREPTLETTLAGIV
jgi:hypothetical protein